MMECCTPSSGGEQRQKPPIKKGSWTPSEDALLLEFVEKYGESNWNTAHLLFPELRRGGKSCRMRYRNQLRHGLRKGPFSPAEQLVVARGVALYGNQWSKIADMLPGRTDNSVKNYWNVRLKRLKRQHLVEEASKRARLSPAKSPSSSSASSFLSCDGEDDMKALLVAPALQHLPSSININGFQVFGSDVQVLQPRNPVHVNGTVVPQHQVLSEPADAHFHKLSMNVAKEDHSAGGYDQEECQDDDDKEDEFTSVCIRNVPDEEEFPSVQMSAVPIWAVGKSFPDVEEEKDLHDGVTVEKEIDAHLTINSQEMFASSMVGGEMNPFLNEELPVVVHTNDLHHHSGLLFSSFQGCCGSPSTTPQEDEQLPSVQARHPPSLTTSSPCPSFDRDLLEAFAQSSSCSSSSVPSFLTDCVEDLLDLRSSSLVVPEPPSQYVPRCFDLDILPFVNGTLDSLVISSSSMWRSMPPMAEVSFLLI